MGPLEIFPVQLENCKNSGIGCMRTGTRSLHTFNMQDRYPENKETLCQNLALAWNPLFSKKTACCIPVYRHSACILLTTSLRTSFLLPVKLSNTILCYNYTTITLHHCASFSEVRAAFSQCARYMLVLAAHVCWDLREIVVKVNNEWRTKRHPLSRV